MIKVYFTHVIWSTGVCVLQPVAEEPFTFEMELDDLPKECLKEMIYKEIENLMKRNQASGQGNTPTPSIPLPPPH